MTPHKCEFTTLFNEIQMHFTNDTQVNVQKKSLHSFPEWVNLISLKMSLKRLVDWKKMLSKAEMLFKFLYAE